MTIDRDPNHLANIDHLPYDVLLHILRILPSRDIAHLLSCCRGLHALVTEESIWRSLSAAYGLTDVIHFGGRSWYTVYTRLLQPYGPMLGLWAGDHAYTGDVLDIRLGVGSTHQPGGIVLGCWRFPSVQPEDLDRPEMPERPMYTPLIHISLPSVAAPYGGVQVACCTKPGTTPPHQAYIELFSSTSQSLFLHTRQGRYSHPEFPPPEIQNFVDQLRYPYLPLRESTVVDQGLYLAPNPRGYVVYSAPTSHIKPPAISISCSLGCVNRARAFHGFQDDVPYLPRYYPLRQRALPGVDPATREWHPSSLDGLWLGSHGPHGTECLFFRWDGTLSVLYAWKITGDSNVPRGALSWRANTSDPYPISELPDWIHDNEIPNLTNSRFFGGSGRISARGYLPYHSNEMDIILVVCGADEVRTAWMDSGDVAAYIRHA
ncbi:hypothetical protein BD309DRAFT_857213 [Dichomitus squalens]|uniref:uncharacterized protein n=1 Tax=Dichomitus squalens (strain LYAD-421) TaxID=732165 RepID=UPI0004411A2D|nr:uncharacterized protein DICSQDRAFT_49167 [Dichomitus squalens LYAD-421 SS1]EJF66334.1 hypothetical protein DICSQDRAFT_49167 [Dichomitus squalens LYAD-421 SS1]TBU46874.1 hypothetical protein BD309DRAFT_857213 [Dichomitus squalens]